MPVLTPFSATPTFSWDIGDPQVFKIVLTGNVTSSTFVSAGLSVGAHFKFVIIQDAVGGHSFAWPPVCRGALPVGEAANQTTVQTFIWDGSNLLTVGMPAVF